MVKIKMNEISNEKKIAIAFAGTFTFLPTLDLTQKSKRACKPTHRDSANLTLQTFD
jgi:hypothetical protein